LGKSGGRYISVADTTMHFHMESASATKGRNYARNWTFGQRLISHLLTYFTAQN
jgi:hypothetical protein